MLRWWILVLAGCGRVGFDATDAGSTTDTPRALRSCARTFVAKGDQACVARTDGQVWCWGEGSIGQLGDGSTPVVRFLPGPVPIENVTMLGAGEDTICAVKRDGSLACWGDGTLGQIGDGNVTSSSVPVPVPLPAPVTAVRGAQTHTCAVLTDGRGMCWGSNALLALGLIQPSIQATPTGTSIAGNLDVELGDDATCVIRPDHTVACWGSNADGNLGDGTTIERGFARQVAAIPDPVVQVAGGCHKHWCAVTDRHDVWCWGTNADGELGRDAITPFETVPVRVPGLAAVQVAVGATHTCARTASDEVYCWGRNNAGQVGTPMSANELAPMRVEGISGRIVDLQASCVASFVLLSDATLLAWGSAAMLGTGETIDRYTPAEVALPCP